MNVDDDDERNSPVRPRKNDAALERQQRLAAALRENLRRRKAQARARTQDGEQNPAAPKTQDREDNAG